MIFLDDLREASGGQLFGEVAADTFSDFCYDWRAVQPGQLYVALRGPGGQDGHAYLLDAMAAGAAGVLCSNPPPDLTIAGTTFVVVPDTAAALTAWAGHVLTRYGTTVVGVVGAEDGSITRQAVATVLNARYSVHKPPDTFAGRVGIALGLGSLSADQQVSVVSLARGQSGELADVLAMVSPHVAVLTGSGLPSAPEAAGDSQAVAELQEVVAGLPQNGALVLNYDDQRARQPGFDASVRTLSYGLDLGGRGFGADVLAYDITFHPDRTSFDVRHGDERMPSNWLPLPGRPHLYAALAGVAVGALFDVPLDEAMQALAGIQALPGRLAPHAGVAGVTVVDNSYDASVASSVAALDLLAALDDGQRRRVFVMGDVRAAPELSEAAYGEIGRRAAGACDLLVTRGRGAAVAGREALLAGMPAGQVRMVYSHADAANIVRGGLAEGDVVAVTGARQARMERVTALLLAGDVPVDAPSGGQFTAWHAAGPERASVTSWVELDLDAAAQNVRTLKALVGPDVTLCAVVKANAYGHGMLEIASAALNNGAGMLGVDNAHEALALRDAGLDAPILILTYTPAWMARELIRHDLTVTLYDAELAGEFNRVAAEMDRMLNVHVKVDTGMGRLGLLPDDVPDFFRQMGACEYLNFEGLFTHFSVADTRAETNYTAAQLGRFRAVLDALRASGVGFRLVHAANSAATLALRDSHFSMVRTGLAMYGLVPSDDVPLPDGVRPVLAWKTRVAQVKTLPPGSFVGYGKTYQTSVKERVAVLPVGYADGFRRAPNNWGEVLVGGERAPLLGRVSMGLAVANVSHIPNVRVGDEVVLIGRQGEQVITAEEVARRLGTINYEVVTAIPPHVPRVI